MYLKLSISMLLSTMHLHRGTECQENWNDSNFQGGFQTILFTNIREAKSSDPCVHDCIDKVWRHVTRCPSYLDWIVLLSVITYIVIEGPAIYSVQHTHTHPSRENLAPPPPATCGPQNWKFDTPPPLNTAEHRLNTLDFQKNFAPLQYLRNTYLVIYRLIIPILP